MRRTLALLAATLAPALASAQRATPFVGSWRLVSYEQPDSTGRRRPAWGPKPLGVIMYHADGTMAAEGFDDRRPSLKASAAEGGDERARAAAFNGMFAYFGTYQVDAAKGQVTHHVEGAWNSDYVGRDFVRAFRFVDRDHLELRVVSNGDGKPVVNGGVLTWERMRR